MKSLSLVAARAAVIAGLTLGATVAHALPLVSGVTTFTTTAGDGSATWMATWTDATLTLDWDAANQLLTKGVEFKTLNAIDITFTQVGATAPQAPRTLDRFGLRITMTANVKNSTTANWTSFQDKLIDLKPVTAAQNPSASATHPSNPHFHNDTIMPLNGGIGFNNAAISDQDANNKKNLYQFSNGGVLIGQTWTVTGIGIHDWEVTAFTRSFTLREQPNVALPEPSALALVAVGSLVVAGWRWRRA